MGGSPAGTGKCSLELGRSMQAAEPIRCP